MVTFTSLVLRDNKILKPDKDGYYDVALGKLNAYNSDGIFYEFSKEVEQLFLESSILMRRLKEGYLKSEYGHPQQQPGMSMQQYLQRLAKIKERNVCNSINSITLHDPASDGSILISGKVKPLGPYGDALKSELDDPKTNTAYSVRSLVTNRVENNRLIRTIRALITWDFVTEPGVKGMNKVTSLGLESYDDLSINNNEVLKVIKELEDNIKHNNYGMEDSLMLNTIKEGLIKCQEENCLFNNW